MGEVMIYDFDGTLCPKGLGYDDIPPASKCYQEFVGVMGEDDYIVTGRKHVPGHPEKLANIFGLPAQNVKMMDRGYDEIRPRSDAYTYYLQWKVRAIKGIYSRLAPGTKIIVVDDLDGVIDAVRDGFPAAIKSGRLDVVKACERPDPIGAGA